MASDSYRPLKAAAYLVVSRPEYPWILSELRWSLASLRRFHPDLPVLVYHQGLAEEALAELYALPGTMEFPIGVDSPARFEANDYLRRHGWLFPELHVLAAKIDVLLLSPGDTLLLDTDTEVRASLAEILDSPRPGMLESEGLFTAHERNLAPVLDAVRWEAMGWRGDRGRLQVFNSGAVWLPQAWKGELYKAKELLWALTQLPAKERGDNRLDEQLALSIALQEAAGYELGLIAPRVYHYWREKYDRRGEWYLKTHGDVPAHCT